MHSLIALTSLLLAAAAPTSTPKDKAAVATPTPAPASKDKVAAVVPQAVNRSFTTVAKKAVPAVVYIKVTGGGDGEGAAVEAYQNPFDFFSDDFFNKFFGAAPHGKLQKQPQISQGSGFIVSADGYIMTNAHVIKGADKITAILNSGKEINATLVGMDSHTDIAIIKIDGKNLPYVALGDSDVMEVGEWVVAIGSPFQLEASLTVGVVSAKGRQNLKITDWEDFIQTDAAINPGNSGGPLLNLDSEVIGINTAIVSRTGGYMGIGFAVPSNLAKHVMAQIIDKGSVTRGFLGVSMQPVDKDIADAFNLDKPEGILVSEVAKDSPADKAGIQQGDIIVEYNNMPVKTLGSFRNDISLMNPGTRVTLKINRKGKILTVPVVLGSASDSFSSDGAMQKMGLEVDNLTPELSRQLGYNKGEEGVVITKIKPGSPAAVAGMRPGFLIMAINHKKVTNMDDFTEAVKDSENKKRVLILARQGNITRFYSLKME